MRRVGLDGVGCRCREVFRRFRHALLDGCSRHRPQTKAPRPSCLRRSSGSDGKPWAQSLGPASVLQQIAYQGW